MVMDIKILSGAVESFKNFLNDQSSLDEKFKNNIKEDMRHYLRLFKYLEDPSLKEFRIEILDALDELYQIIVIELNAIDINNFAKANSEKNNSNGKNNSNSDSTISDEKAIILTPSIQTNQT